MALRNRLFEEFKKAPFAEFPPPPPHLVQGVEASEGGPDLLHHLGLLGEEALQDPRPGQHLLDLLGPGQVGGDVGTLDGPGALHQQAGLPALTGRGKQSPWLQKHQDSEEHWEHWGKVST